MKEPSEDPFVAVAKIQLGYCPSCKPDGTHEVALGIANDPEAMEALQRVSDRTSLQGVIDLLYEVLDPSGLRTRAIQALERAIERLK